MTENVEMTEENMQREQTAAELRQANMKQLLEQQKANGTAPSTEDAAAARDASVLNGVTREPEAEPAKAAPRRRRAPKPAADAAPAPAKAPAKSKAAPAKTGKAKDKAEPAPAPAPAAEPSNRSHNQDLAKRLIDLVAGEFKAESEEDQIKIANWLKVLPTGGAGYQRYWPTGFARPTTADWRIPS